MQHNIQKQLNETLQKTFGFSEFRPGQLEAIMTLMTHGRLLCIQPTGHGKSLLYQLPSVLLDGLTLVISPLLALMRDQIKQLKERFGILAGSFNTDQNDEENFQTKKALLSGKLRILFIAPEQLDHIDRFEFLLNLPIRLLVVDEAHCISTWGHDFRPSYRQILHITHALIKKHPEIKLIALTATANKKTEIDIKQQFDVDQNKMIVHRESMDRPNIRLSVIHTRGTATKLATLTHLLPSLPGCGLIYCATRENTEVVASFLSTQGIKTSAYHAGIETQQKIAIQNHFIHDEYTVIAATNALGMGIDKPNLRYIIHFDFPGSITAYYQEVGRAGRDGLPAEGILLYDPTDCKVQKYFIESAQPDSEEFLSVLDIVDEEEAPLATLKRKSGMHPTKLIVVLAELVEQGFLKKSMVNRKQTYQTTKKKGAPNLIRYVTQRKIKLADLKAIQHFAEQSSACLMTILRKALGDEHVADCGQCSQCTKTPMTATYDKECILSAASWLERRTIPILLTKKLANIGVAVLDGKLRSDDFVRFMRERASSDTTAIGLSDSLLQLIKECLNDLLRHHPLSCIVPLPSRTWCARSKITKLLAHYLKIPSLFDLLYWDPLPDTRQGELLNNDQRQHNVAQRMRIKLDEDIPAGTILLFDDYIGSGATLNEAANALREQAKIKNKIVPFTIAAVKWRLGKKGMI